MGKQLKHFTYCTINLQLIYQASQVKNINCVGKILVAVPEYTMKQTGVERHFNQKLTRTPTKTYMYIYLYMVHTLHKFAKLLMDTVETSAKFIFRINGKLQ